MTNKTKALALENVLLPVFISVLVLLVLLQANPLTNYPSRDGGIYAYVGHIILEGKLPYIDAWESKTPGIFYLDAFALWLAKGTRWGIWIVEYVFLFTSAWIGYKLMRSIWRPGAAMFGTLIWLFGLNQVLSGGNFTEEYPLLFNFLAFYVLWESLKRPEKVIYDFIIGLTLGLSILFRANNIGTQVTIVLANFILYLVEKKLRLFWKKLVILGAGAIVVLGGVGIYFWAKHAFFAMVEAAFLYNFSYTGKHADLWWGILSGFENLGFTAWVALAGYILVVVMFIKNVKPRVIEYFPVLLIIGLPIEMVLSSLSGRGYGHYFISWLPVMSLLSAYAFSWLSPRMFTLEVNEFVNKRAGITLSLLIGLLIFVFWNPLQVYGGSIYHILNRSRGVELVSPVAQYIRSTTDPNDTVLIWGGQAGLNLMARRDSPTAYFFYPLFVSSPVLSKLEEGFFNDIMTQPPVMIVDAYSDAPDDVLSLDSGIRQAQIDAGKGQIFHPSNLDSVLEYIESHYELETRIENYAIYRLIRTP